MNLETPIIIEKKLEEFNKLAAIGHAVEALIKACELNEMKVEEVSEIVASMAIRRMRKNMPAYKRK